MACASSRDILSTRMPRLLFLGLLFLGPSFYVSAPKPIWPSLVAQLTVSIPYESVTSHPPTISTSCCDVRFERRHHPLEQKLISLHQPLLQPTTR
jgi:hypothetical protein